MGENSAGVSIQLSFQVCFVHAALTTCASANVCLLSFAPAAILNERVALSVVQTKQICKLSFTIQANLKKDKLLFFIIVLGRHVSVFARSYVPGDQVCTADKDVPLQVNRCLQCSLVRK